MPRERISDTLARRRMAAAASVSRAVAKKVGARPRMASRSAVVCEVVLMLKTGNWSDARPAHLVELYAWCHEKVYRVRPVELDQRGERGRRERMAAIGAARTLVEREFEGRVVECVAFLRWAWAREEGRERWAKEKCVERGRLAWRALFSGRGILGDYLKALATRRVG